MNKSKKGAVLTDFLIMTALVSALSLAVFGVRRLFGLGKEEAGRVVYTLFISELDEEFESNVAVGDELISADTKQPIGKVCAVTATEAFRESYSERLGTMIHSPVPSKKALTITVESGYKSDTGLTVGGVKLICGNQIHVRSRSLFFIAEIGRITI